MLFHSYTYLFLFLPVTVAVYFWWSRHFRQIFAEMFLIAAGLFFYAWWDWRYLPLLAASVGFNFYIGRRVAPKDGLPDARQRKTALIFGLAVNLGTLAFFKYSDFIVENLNLATGLPLASPGLPFPPAISFFTFVQIAYLVDRYRGEAETESFFKYVRFATFFPQLLSGPIVRHGYMKPQYDRPEQGRRNWENIHAGLVMLAMGLFKKVFVADTFATWATAGFDHAISLNLVEAWIASISYTLQIYYDFSGYTDMAIGSALFFNIRLPANFNSPYKALNVQDFWRRWHITLSSWLRDYLFIPLGGSRGSALHTYRNLMITFVLCGLWHGAGWTFIFWGGMHGVAIVLHRMWARAGFRMPKVPAWVLTFLFLNIGWVFFRAPDFATAAAVLKNMVDFGDLNVAGGFSGLFSVAHLSPGNEIVKMALWLAGFSGLAIAAKNSQEIVETMRPSFLLALFTLILLLMGMPDIKQPSGFVYFNF